MSAITQSMEAIMDDDVGLLKLRVSKFPLKLLKDAEQVRLHLLNGGWARALIEDHIGEAIAFAVEKRREWLAARRARRAAEKAADKAWSDQCHAERVSAA